MPRTTLIAVNNNAGAFTNVPATIPAHYVEIAEDGSVAAPQGLEVQFPGDGYATTDTYKSSDEPISLTGHGHNGALGHPAQNNPGDFNYRAADVYCKVRSATATATTIRVFEDETHFDS